MAFCTKVYANVAAIQNADRLNSERLRRIVEARSVAEAFKMLGETGYAYTDVGSVDGFIVAETDALIDFIAETAPSASFSAALTARFVYNNAKLAYKSRFIETPDDGYYRTSLDCEKISAGDYSDTDKYMRAALEALDEAGERRPQIIDLSLTRAMYESVLACGIPVVKKYFRAEIDMKNILSAARMKRLGITGDEFIPGGKIRKDALDEAVVADGFAEFFEHTPYAEFAENIEQNELKNLWKAELDADDRLFYMTRADVARFSAYDPFLNYYTQALIELKTVKTALVCVKTDARDTFFERMPMLYK